MSEAIKLFGMTISPLPCEGKDESVSENRHSSLESYSSHDTKDGSVDDYEKWSEEEPTSSETNDDPKKDDSNEIKKPEKIIRCPRCSSMDTKFCYFNNYNVNQPRHFCKKCQRYWTSGGTMRNVPVGSGRRKTKNTLLPSYPNMISNILDSSVGSNGNLLISPRGFPVSFYPATLYWGSSVCNVNTADDPPLLRLPVLGKHSRDGKENHGGILVPKTLRIHDPIEAAKSSIWSTLGIKNGNNGMFKALESKGERFRGVGEREMMMQANPAAFSRSLNFHERV